MSDGNRSEVIVIARVLVREARAMKCEGGDKGVISVNEEENGPLDEKINGRDGKIKVSFTATTR